MKEYEREALLDKVERESATVGATVPDAIELRYSAPEGEEPDTLALKSLVFELRRLDGVDPEDRERAQAAKKGLRRERLARRQHLEEADLTREEADRLVESIVGIDRALNALADLGVTDIESEIEAKERADTQRWRSFLDKVLGEDDPGRGGR